MQKDFLETTLFAEARVRVPIRLYQKCREGLSRVREVEVDPSEVTLNFFDADGRAISGLTSDCHCIQPCQDTWTCGPDVHVRELRLQPYLVEPRGVPRVVRELRFAQAAYWALHARLLALGIDPKKVLEEEDVEWEEDAGEGSEL